MSNTPTPAKELVQEIMQAGFDVAMGGDSFKSEEENEQEQRRQHEAMVKKYAKLLEQRDATAHAVGREEAFKNVGSWYKAPIRKGMTMTKNIDGTGGLVDAGCEVCGGKLVMVRGRHPGEENRQTCPTCALDIIEGILDSCNNRQAYSAKPTETIGNATQTGTGSAKVSGSDAHTKEE